MTTTTILIGLLLLGLALCGAIVVCLLIVAVIYNGEELEMNMEDVARDINGQPINNRK